MLIVTIGVNFTDLHTLTAVNVSRSHGLKYGKGKQIYDVKESGTDNKWIVEHTFEDGATVLAEKMLNKVNSKHTIEKAPHKGDTSCKK